MASKENWGTKLGFVLATMGAAIGCGNLWRFPYMVGKYGEAAFLFVYVAIVAFISFPLLTAEVAMGRKTRKDPVGAFQTLAPGTRWFLGGYLNVAVSFMWLAYLTPIFGWFLGYFFKIAMGTFKSMPPEKIAVHFPSFIAQGNIVFLLSLSLVALIVFIVRKGVRQGVEKTNNILMPILFVILVVLIIRALTLPGAAKGLEFYLKPDFSKLSLEAVLGALGQALFSVGVAVGVGIVFGSYLPEDNSSITRKTAVVCVGDTLVAFLAGLMIFPSVFAFGLEPNSGGGLLFVTLPNVFNQLPMGTMIGCATVLLFMIAMLTSQVACFETVVCFMEETLKVARERAIWILAALLCVLIYINANFMKIFSIFDYVTSNIFLTGGALLLALFVGWKWKVPAMMKAASIESGHKTWIILLKYFVPVAILLVWASWIF